MNDLMKSLRQLVQDDDDRQNALFNLWTWLPSRIYASRAFGDYADEFRPLEIDLLKEVITVIDAFLYFPDESDIRQNQETSYIPSRWRVLDIDHYKIEVYDPSEDNFKVFTQDSPVHPDYREGSLEESYRMAYNQKLALLTNIP